MRPNDNIDPILRALGGRSRYQLLQLFVQYLGSIGAAYQLLDNIFIGRSVEGQRCAPPNNHSDVPPTLQGVDWNSSHVQYGKCDITVNASNQMFEHSCMFGWDYDYRRELSFRTEFDLVCDLKLLGSLAQSFVIMGQGVGAVLSSIVSDRFGRKRTLVGSQLGLLVVGMAIGLSPSYPLLAVFKFLVGCFQQGVVTGAATMSIELFPTEYRSLQMVIGGVVWGLCSCSMTLISYLWREYTWRYLQYTLSGASLLVFLFQFWYLDESIRWLVANGRKEAVVVVLKRAARQNGIDLDTVLHAFYQTHATTNGVARKNSKAENGSTNGHINPGFNSGTQNDLKKSSTKSAEDVNGKQEVDVTSDAALEKSLREKEAEKLSILDLFRNKRLLFNACIIWVAWFTTAFSFFTLYMMSTSLHGDRFVNYFLTALMELPPNIFFFLLVDRIGRKTSSRLIYFITGTGLIVSGVGRHYSEYSAARTLSVVMAMVGMFGASGSFGAVFFFTPELFPTNMRNQALGVSSFAGRLGGMLAPFMADLAEIAVWAPGAIIGSLCFVVVIILHFIPETSGRELPHTIADIEKWYSDTDGGQNSTEDLKKPPPPSPETKKDVDSWEPQNTRL